jgi:hypothetical protein
MSWWIVGIIAFILSAAGKRMLGQEVETLLMKVPGLLLKWACRRIGSEHRDELYIEWLGVLDEAAEDFKGRPIGEVLLGIKFGLGVVYAAPIVAKERARAAALAAR